MARPTSRTGNRSVVYPGAMFDFPPPIGEARIKFDHDAMEWIEEALEAELDKLNDRIRDGKGPIDDHTGEPVEIPYESVWDALGEISSRRLAKATRVLVQAGLAHRHDGDVDDRVAAARDEVGKMPFHLWTDDELTSALNRALTVAFGRDIDPLADGESTDGPPPPPAPPAGGASGSDGTTSSPHGPPPSTPEA